jgi:acyl dehydratase
MKMNLEHVIARRFEPVEQRYDWRDCALYALGLGFGSGPLDEDELLYVYEEREQRVVPSQSLILGWLKFWQDSPETGIDWVKMLHGEESFELHRPLPLAASIRATRNLKAVVDKGVGRGALMYFETEVADAASGERLASLRTTHFLRGDGGCGSHGAPPPTVPPLAEGDKPSASIVYRTIPQAALLYRLVSHDYMAIHADPEVARRAGFDRPISHGLNTMGLACRAILKHFCPRRPELMTSMFVRFVQPAFPGETIRVDLYDEGDRIRFRALAVDRNTIVLDRGECRLAGR